MLAPPTKEQLNELYQLYKQGLHDQVLQKASQLLQHVKPVSYLYNLPGIIHAKNGNHHEAQSFFRKALELEPNRADLHYNLAKTLKESENFSDALLSYQNAIAFDPNHAMAHHNMGIVHKELGNLPQSLQSIQKALELDSTNPDFFNSLGSTLNQLHRYEDALQAYTDSLNLAPKNHKTHLNLGILHRNMGNTESAIKHYEKSLEYKPDYSEAVHELILLKKVQPGDPHLKQLLKLLEKSAKNTLLHFTLGKAYHDMHDTRRAFEHFKSGNQLRKHALNYDIQEDEKFFGKIILSFESFTVKPAPLDNPTRPYKPIFIIGMPRSGTSLVEQILASHSQVFGAGELNILHQLALPFLDHLAYNATPNALQNVSRDILKSYMCEVSERFGSYPVITDKMPTNFLWLGFILLAIPEAKIIHLNRDPMAVCWSIYQRYFPSKGLGFAYDIGDLSRYYRLYTDLMAFWKIRFPGSIYDLDYESLTENQEEESKKLLAYCELEWEEECLEFYNTKRGVSTASATQVREKMYTGSSTAWKEYEAYLEPLKKLLES